jgi:hypothetical protein
MIPANVHAGSNSYRTLRRLQHSHPQSAHLRRSTSSGFPPTSVIETSRSCNSMPYPAASRQSCASRPLLRYPRFLPVPNFFAAALPSAQEISGRCFSICVCFRSGTLAACCLKVVGRPAGSVLCPPVIQCPPGMRVSQGFGALRYPEFLFEGRGWLRVVEPLSQRRCGIEARRPPHSVFIAHRHALC